MEYPSGLRHVIFNSATPIDDGAIQLMQILFRNDREEDCSTAELIEWDKAIIEEDREILESTDPDAIVDMGRKIEMHMPSDRPGMIMRKRLNALGKSRRARGSALRGPRPVGARLAATQTIGLAAQHGIESHGQLSYLPSSDWPAPALHDVHGATPAHPAPDRGRMT